MAGLFCLVTGNMAATGHTEPKLFVACLTIMRYHY